MNKTEIKKTAPSQKKKVVNKKNQNNSKIAVSDKKEKMNYPLWTTPEHLDESDHKALKRFYELFISGKIISAFSFVSNFDTIVREAIPAEIWEQSGGKPTEEGEKELNNAPETGKTSPTEPVNHEENEMIGKVENSKPEPPIANESTSPVQKPEPIEIKFESNVELEQVVLVNSKTFFGENTLLFKSNNEVRNERFPDKFLLDFSNAEKPKIYFIEIVLPEEQIFGQCFIQITHLFALLRNKKNHEELMWKLHSIINSNEEQKNELQTLMQKHVEIPEFLSTLLENRPFVLLITAGVKSELSLYAETYTDTWGKMLKTLIIRKFSNEGDITYPLSPVFADLFKNDKSKPDVIRCTEADHLLTVSTIIRSVYMEIKDALLEADNSIEFNAKKIYISVRKNKNLAFFHLHKKISLVVMNPEEDTRENIKHHVIKSLPASVQKFWNGPSCTIIIENSVNLDEVIDLLKRMIGKAQA